MIVGIVVVFVKKNWVQKKRTKKLHEKDFVPKNGWSKKYLGQTRKKFWVQKIVGPKNM